MKTYTHDISDLNFIFLIYLLCGGSAHHTVLGEVIAQRDRVSFLPLCGKQNQFVMVRPKLLYLLSRLAGPQQLSPYFILDNLFWYLALTKASAACFYPCLINSNGLEKNKRQTSPKTSL